MARELRRAVLRPRVRAGRHAALRLLVDNLTVSGAAETLFLLLVAWWAWIYTIPATSRRFMTSGPGRLRRDNGGVLELRSFCAGDAEAAWRLHDAALEEAGVHGGRGPWEDDLRDIRGTCLNSGGDFLVGRIDGELVAMGGLLRRSPDEAEIRRMRVHPDFQRRGFGRLLLQRLEERAQALGYRVIRLDTTDQQTAARRLYDSAGYRETGRRQTARFLFIDFTKTLNPH